VTPFWEEAAIAAFCSFVLFVVFSTQAAVLAGRFDAFPIVLRHLLAPSVAEGGPTRRPVLAISAAVFAAIGQSPVLAVAGYRGAQLGVVAILLLVGEAVAAVAWVLALRHWMKVSAAR
jgi:hypothetical protein